MTYILNIEAPLVERLFHPTFGIIGRQNKRDMERALALSKAIVANHTRTGNLLRSFTPVRQNRDYSGRYSVGHQFGNAASYAAAVDQGVPHRIYPKSAQFLEVPDRPRAGHVPPFIYLDSVKGQKGIGFLKRAAEVALAKY